MTYQIDHVWPNKSVNATLTLTFTAGSEPIAAEIERLTAEALTKLAGTAHVPAVQPEQPEARGIVIDTDKGEVRSDCCDASVNRLVEYTDTHVFAFGVEDDPDELHYSFVKTYDGGSGEGERFVCDDCGNPIEDARLDAADEA